MNSILGIDVGGSGIKGAIVDIKTGEFKVERLRYETPPNAKPYEIGKIIAKIAKSFDYKGIIGVGFPAVVSNGYIKTAANIDKSNIDVNAEELFSKICKTKVFLINDADAAATAEMKFGHGKKSKGTTLFLTIGTGIGSALFINKKILPNTEFGHLILPNGLIAEKYTSDAVRKKEKLDWSKWGQRFNQYLNYVDKLLNPELIIIGGGASKKIEKFIEEIDLKEKIKPAMLLNNAGIIGAAIFASKKMKKFKQDKK